MANSVTTNAARIKFAQAHKEGAIVHQITQVGWGDGGHNPADNTVLTPSGSLIQVPGEFLVKAIDSASYPITTTARFTVSLGKTEGNGETVSSCGLYDSTGTLVAVKNFTPKVKDNEMDIIINWDEEF